MPRIARELGALEIQRLEAGIHQVGGVAGLLFQVTETGARSWLLRITVAGKRRELGLGPYPEIRLAEARRRAAELREQIRHGIDPVATRRAARAALVAQKAKSRTFEQCAETLMANKRAEFRNAKHAAQWETTLATYVYPIIGNLPVESVELAHVVRILEPIWHEKTETASRVRGRIERVLGYAKVSGYRSGDNPARWRDNLDAVLATPSKIRKKEHHPALPFVRMGEFWAHLEVQQGMGAKALAFAILTAARCKQVRFATWAEIDLDSRLWTAPAAHTKKERTHRVPLSDEAERLLKALPRTSDLLFPAPRGGELSDMTLGATIQRMHEHLIAKGLPGYTDPQCGRRIVPHGFRSTFKDWCRTSTTFADEVSELALAHVDNDATRAAYARDELLPKRALLMDEWAKFVTTPTAVGEVIGIRQA